MVSCVSFGRGGWGDGRTIFYGWDDPEWVAASGGIGGPFEQWRNRESAALRRATANRPRERRPRTRHAGVWTGAYSAWGRDPRCDGPKEAPGGAGHGQRRRFDAHTGSEHPGRKRQRRRQHLQGGRLSEAVRSAWAPAESRLGTDRTGNRGGEMGMEKTVHRPMEWQGRFQSGESDCRGSEPATVDLRERMGVDRGATRECRRRIAHFAIDDRKAELRTSVGQRVPPRSGTRRQRRTGRMGGWQSARKDQREVFAAPNL